MASGSAPFLLQFSTETVTTSLPWQRGHWEVALGKSNSPFSMNKQTFSKFVRPNTPTGGVITDRDLNIIETILRYRFSPFSLRFPARPGANQLSHFCYEADRGSMPMADMRTKLRAYRHFIKQQLHVEAFGVHPIRAVLIETTEEPRARKLMDLAQEAVVMGNSKRSGLFWFVISPLFTGTVKTADGRKDLAIYQKRPAIILDSLWVLPDLTLHSLSDLENSH